MTGFGLAVILFLGFGAFASLFTTDSEVLDITRSGLLVREKKMYALESFTGCIPISCILCRF